MCCDVLVEGEARLCALNHEAELEPREEIRTEIYLCKDPYSACERDPSKKWGEKAGESKEVQQENCDKSPEILIVKLLVGVSF
jgi:hypothetical protein